MKQFITGVMLALSCAWASADTIYYDDGSYVEVPAGQKVIIVPAWVRTNRLFMESPVPVFEPEANEGHEPDGNPYVPTPEEVPCPAVGFGPPRPGCGPGDE